MNAPKLTDRELVVLDYLAAGGTQRKLARYLGVTEAAVRMLTHRLYGKLDVRNAAQAVAVALRAGLIR